MKQLVVIDCQNDFISGSLACHHAHEAVNNIINYLNENTDVVVFYSQDWHKPSNQSFEVNGGIWPVHCAGNEYGSALSDEFSQKLKNKQHLPNVSNKYMKGQDDVVEEYSAFYAQNKDGLTLFEQLEEDVVIAGIASEYCVLETTRELVNAGHKVTVLKDGLGYVDEETHQRALQEYDRLGVTWL